MWKETPKQNYGRSYYVKGNPKVKLYKNYKSVTIECFSND